MFKKFATGLIMMVLIAGLLAACGSGDKKKDTDEAYKPKELKIGFVPSQNAETLEARAKPLADLLSKELDIPVEVKVTTDYNGVVEAMGSKQLDLGFLPPTDYVLAHNKGYADVLLQALRYGVDPKTGEDTDEKVEYYYAGLLVKNDSGIEKLEDLKGKKIGWQGPTSSAGYVWAAVEMNKKGINPQKDVEGVQLQGHDKGVQAVLDGDVDAASVFVDARNILKNDIPDIFDKTHYMYQTAKIPNDTVSVRPDMDKKWKEKIADAFIKIGEDPKGQKIIHDIYTHVGYKKSKDSNFDTVREYSDEINKIGQ
ncbi:phosphate/phosphite/phosphonate ABC transporter substrate-binding protein [Virgibacillus halophilus]|uniref:phosphate/phosphite/phosphonate ABC transporter substrate-binding protein n=1 Tax=Tigheibacillus halophilus TaxID=361280 RepID=UPI003636A90F